MAEVPTPEQVEQIKTWVGPNYDETEIYTLYDRFAGDMDDTILHILNLQRARYLEIASSVSLPSGLNVSFNGKAKEVDDQIARFVAQGGTDGLSENGVSVYRLKRADYR